MTSPLTGVRVLDLAHFVAGPWCTQMLADLGADVIKVEPPGGEIGRSMGAVYREGESAIFLGFNRGKQSITLDLKRPEDQRRAQELAATCDVVVHNFRPGTAERLGMGAALLRSTDPTLVHCAVSAFGPDGPAAGRPANDPVIQALSGALDETGGGVPVRMAVSLPDFAAATLAASSILAALLRRASTGRGCSIELSLLDAQLYAQNDLMTTPCDESITGRKRAELGACSCRDGVVWIDSADHAAVARALHAPGPEHVEAVLEHTSRADAVRELVAAGIAAAPVHELHEVLPGPPGRTMHVEHPRLGRLSQLPTPLAAQPPWPPANAAPPLLGQHDPGPPHEEETP
ncbi:CaiB/BaiF CoA transferase family protein [Serinicoccus kebangsaanensis]|uniref:CaiB/BaiF CoA transferase family protein n=1 Tax=Serinicoccus kebangsaanensis TaxID=2602069 RepID=UPI00124C1E6A|nr:CoA transferase [Serinicoccus kebangsaanensis]